MQRSGYSLYDRYQLSNSSAIPTYNGSNGEAAIKVGQYMQGLYDQNVGTALNVNNGVDNMQGHPADTDVVNATRDYYKGQLRKLSESGDWENMLPQTQQLAGNYARDAQAISSIQQQKAEWAKQLDDKDNKLTSVQKSTLSAIADDEYKNSPYKLQRDASGRLRGQYSGTRVDKNLDINEWVDKRMKDFAVQEGGQEIVSGTDGAWIMKNGVKWKRVDPRMIQSALSTAASNDEEFKGYVDMMGRISSYGTDKVTNPDQVNAGPIKTAAMALVAKGIPFNQALKQVVYNQTGKQILNSTLGYGTTKYTLNDKWTTQDVQANPFELKKTKEGPDHTPTIIEDVDSQTTNDERNPVKLGQNIESSKKDIANTDKEIAFYESKLPSLTGDARTQMEAQRDEAVNRRAGLEAQVNRGTSIKDYSALKTAQALGYKDYNDFVSQQSTSLVPKIEATFPKGLKNMKGVRLSPKDIAEAVVDGRVDTEYNGGSSYGTMGSSVKKTVITTKDGQKVTLLPEHGAAALSLLVDNLNQNNRSKVKEFNDLNKSTFADNVQNFAVKSTSVTLSEDDSKDFTNALKGSKGGVDFYIPGTNTPISQGDKDDIADFRVLTAGTPAPDGKSKFKVEVLDDKGKPTGQVYETHSTDNTRAKLARLWDKNKTPESKQLAQIMTPGSGFEKLQPAELGAGVSLSKKVDIDGKEIEVKLKQVRADGGTPEWRLVDSDGKTIRSTKELGTAGNWYEKLK